MLYLYFFQFNTPTDQSVVVICTRSLQVCVCVCAYVDTVLMITNLNSLQVYFDYFGVCALLLYTQINLTSYSNLVTHFWGCQSLDKIFMPWYLDRFLLKLLHPVPVNTSYAMHNWNSIMKNHMAMASGSGSRASPYTSSNV